MNCVMYGLFLLSQHDFEVMAIHESQTYASRLLIDFLSQTFIEELTGLILAAFICLHSWKLWMFRQLEGRLYVHCTCSILSTSIDLAYLVSLTCKTS